MNTLDRAAFEFFASMRTVHADSYSERHALAVAFVYDRLGRAPRGTGREKWVADGMGLLALECQVCELVGKPPPVERVPIIKRPRAEVLGDPASDAALIHDLISMDDPLSMQDQTEAAIFATVEDRPC